MKALTLRPLEEIIGVLQRLEKDALEVAVVLSCSNHLIKVVFPTDSPEAYALNKVLSKDLSGFKVGILRTDDPSKPLLIRIETGVSKNLCLEAEVEGE